MASRDLEQSEKQEGHAIGIDETARSLDDGNFVTETEERDLHRGLAQRHIQMIALAGAIGTGLFLGLGSALQTGGPLGALLGYAAVGALVCAVMFALGEVTALLPVTGSFVRPVRVLRNCRLVPILD